jgi:hypothetical protein
MVIIGHRDRNRLDANLSGSGVLEAPSQDRRERRSSTGTARHLSDPPTIDTHLLSKAAHGRSNRRPVRLNGNGSRPPGFWRDRPLRTESDGSCGVRSARQLSDRFKGRLYNATVVYSQPTSGILRYTKMSFSLPFPRRPPTSQQRETDAGRPNGGVSGAPRSERENRPAATENAGRGGGRIHTHVTIPRSSFPFRRARHFCPTGARPARHSRVTGAGAGDVRGGGADRSRAEFTPPSQNCLHGLRNRG